MYAVSAYIAYLFISISVTIWVARALSRNGRVFLIDTFLHNEPLADAVNNLLVVGFYLVNVGYVALALRYGARPTDPAGTIESMSTKVGLVLLVLGGMHFFTTALNTLEQARYRRSNSASNLGRLVLDRAFLMILRRFIA